MAVFNTFTFDGENSLDYGVYITGEAVYNAPERAVEMVSIPGKNGALALDQGRFENIEVTYPAGMFGVKQAAFAGRMRAMRNMLASRYKYVRLTDSYHPDEYRLGLYKSGLEASPVAMSSAGEFDITFNCKPQRFLTSGEEPVDTSELGGEVTTDKIPYLFRRSGGGNIGHDFDAEIDKIIGGTVAWNQRVPQSNLPSVDSSPVSNTQITNVSDGTVTITVGSGGASAIRVIYVSNTPFPANHVVLSYNHLTNGSMSSVATNCYNGGDGLGVWDIGSGKIAKPTASGNFNNIVIFSGCPQGTYKVTPQIIDLTQMFGSTIADYIYSLEQTTAGSGIAWLKSHGFLTKDYYAYNTGSLLSVKTSEHRTVGFNAWDEEWELGIWASNGTKTPSSEAIRCKNYIPVIPNTTYYAKHPLVNIIIRLLDSEKNVINTLIQGNATFNIPSNCHYIVWCTFASDNMTTYNHDICINISKTTGSPKNGDYVPYESHSYALDSDLELRGLFKLDANNNLYADGDIYPPSGAVTRKYGRILFDGSTGWFKDGSDRFATGVTVFSDGVPKISNPDSTNNPSNAVCNLFTVARQAEVAKYSGRFAISKWGDNYYYYFPQDDFADTTAFKNWVANHNIEIFYELATPTTEQADPYDSPQVVNPLGTEEYIDTRDVPVPVGHETMYGMSQLILTNPAEFPSKPLLEVTGVGTFWLGDTQFTITGTAGQTIYIDCETGEAWKNTGGVITPANGLVTLNRLDFPELDPGDTAVMYGSGITKVVVTPRWWII